MNLEKLLEYLDLEEAGQFEYFDNIADLVEADVEIPAESIYALFSEIEMSGFIELLNQYFEDILESVPEDSVELYTLLETVKMALVGMASNIEEEKDLILLADEFYRFRNWYSLDSKILVHQEEKDLTHEKELSLRDALTLSRMEKLGGEKFEYTFDEAIDFEMDEYSMSFADLASEDKLAEQEEYEEEFN